MYVEGDVVEMIMDGNNYINVAKYNKKDTKPKYFFISFVTLTTKIEISD